MPKDQTKSSDSADSLHRAGSALAIVAAAIWQDGKVYRVEKPGRHHDLIRLMVEAGLPKPIKGTQGFLDSNGKFVEREPAKKIARAAGQLLARASKSASLFSEDVW